MDRLTWQEIRVSEKSKFCNIMDTVIVVISNTCGDLMIILKHPIFL